MAWAAPMPAQSAMLTAGLPGLAPPAAVAVGAAQLGDLDTALQYFDTVRKRRRLNAATTMDEATAFLHTMECAVACSTVLQAPAAAGIGAVIAAAVGPLLAPINARLLRLDVIDARLQRMEARQANGKAKARGADQAFTAFAKVTAGFHAGAPAAWAAANVGDLPPAHIFPQNDAAVNGLTARQINSLRNWYNEPAFTAALAAAIPASVSGRRAVVRDWICD